MINLYDSSIIELKIKELKKYKVLFYIVLFFTVLTEIIFCFLIEYKNKNIMQPIMIIFGVILSILLVFLYFYFIYPNQWTINRYTFMNESFKHQLIGEVESINKSGTLRRNVIGKEISFLVDGSSVVLFLEDNDNPFEFYIGKKYSISTCDNFIVTVEEVIDE